MTEPSVPDRTGSSHPRHQPAVSLTSVIEDLDRLIASVDGRSMTLAEMEDALRGRGVALLVLVLSIPFVVPIPIPLLATVCGVPMIVIGLRMAITGRVLLPAFARKRRLTPEGLAGIAGGLRRVLRPVAFLFRPRLAPMFWAVPWRLTGASIALAAFVLSLPIPVPLANMIPAIGLIHLASGLLQRDGVAICVGHAFTLGSYVYLYFIWDLAVGVIMRVVQ